MAGKNISKYCKTLIFGGYFYLALLAVETKDAKIRNQISESGICFKIEEITSSNGLLLKEEYAPNREHILPLRVTPMRIEHIFKGPKN